MAGEGGEGRGKRGRGAEGSALVVGVRTASAPWLEPRSGVIPYPCLDLPSSPPPPLPDKPHATLLPAPPNTATRRRRAHARRCLPAARTASTAASRPASWTECSTRCWCGAAPRATGESSWGRWRAWGPGASASRSRWVRPAWAGRGVAARARGASVPSCGVGCGCAQARAGAIGHAILQSARRCVWSAVPRLPLACWVCVRAHACARAYEVSLLAAIGLVWPLTHTPWLGCDGVEPALRPLSCCPCWPLTATTPGPAEAR